MSVITFRPIIPDDESFLWEMLYTAIHVPEGQEPPPRSILEIPEIAHYVQNWGRVGDMGILAEVEGVPVGAAWVRVFPDDDRGYGFVDAQTPEITISIYADWRGQGIGSQLMTRLIDELEKNYTAVSLSVSLTNPAKRLYERLGFVDVGLNGDSMTMVKRI